MFPSGDSPYYPLGGPGKNLIIIGLLVQFVFRIWAKRQRDIQFIIHISKTVKKALDSVP